MPLRRHCGPVSSPPFVLAVWVCGGFFWCVLAPFLVSWLGPVGTSAFAPRWFGCIPAVGFFRSGLLPIALASRPLAVLGVGFPRSGLFGFQGCWPSLAWGSLACGRCLCQRRAPAGAHFRPVWALLAVGFAAAVVSVPGGRSCSLSWRLLSVGHSSRRVAGSFLPCSFWFFR